MILPIYVYGSDVLRAKSVEVDINNINKEEFGKFLEDMQETMENADGVGLAAPQVGQNIRVLIVDGREIADSFSELKDFRRVMINPVVEEVGTEISKYSEGCLSVPDVNCDIERPASMKIKYLNENFEEKEEFLEKFACRMVQHEMDHLDGVLFVDRAAPIRKKMIGSKLHNISKGKVRTSYRIK